MLEQHNEVQTNAVDKKMANVKDRETGGVSENHVFEIPMKRVLGINDVSLWEKSEAYQVRNFTLIHRTHTRAEFWAAEVNIFHCPCHLFIFQEYLGFIFAIGDAIRGITIRDIKVEELDPQDVAFGLINLIETLGNWVDEIPPAEQQQRFGNKSFREWHKRMSEVSNRADMGRVGESAAEGGGPPPGSLIRKIHSPLPESPRM